jgi:hypothetical protein
MRFAAALVVLLAACSQSAGVGSPNGSTASAARPHASPTPAASTGRSGAYAVMVKDFLVEGGPNYTVSIVATDGRVIAGSTVPKRTNGVQIGNLSTSRTTLYYLDGDSDIRFLRPDGEKGIATHITLAAKQVAAFAVSPDDRQIAVSVLDYTRYPVSTRLYVEDLIGGGNHVELFSSPTVLEWPAGWHNGSLVMAVGLNAHPQNAYEGVLRCAKQAIRISRNRLQARCATSTREPRWFRGTVPAARYHKPVCVRCRGRFRRRGWWRRGSSTTLTEPVAGGRMSFSSNRTAARIPDRSPKTRNPRVGSTPLT